MTQLKVFCEGITDQVFIADCLHEFWDIACVREKIKGRSDKLRMTFGENSQIIEVAGCENLINEVILNELRDNSEEGGLNIVVFDADFSVGNLDTGKQGTGNNGYASAKKKLEDIRIRHKVDFEFYLWHNNAHDGEVENLLCQLIPEDKKVIFNCISHHRDCLTNSGLSGLEIADLKQQINFYLHTLQQKTKPADRNYRVRDYWQLNHTQTSDLKFFKEFLSRYFES